MIPRTNPPRLRQEPPNYAILNLNGAYSDIHTSWRQGLLDFRHWCYNNSENRYDYGGTDKRSCEAPGSGNFCFYTTYEDKWMCSVVDGATLYMNGHITRSVGPKEERRICENRQADGKTHLIEDSVYMEWNGSYIKEPLPVGAGALISSFSPLHKNCEGEKIPLRVLQKAGQVYFLHLPEAGRFDSLCLDKIDKDFIAGGIVQVTDIERHQNWSADCKVIRAEIAKPAPRTDAEIEKRAKIQLLIKDIRVMHKLGVRDGAFKLEDMPFQLDKNGRVQDAAAIENDPVHDPLAIVPAVAGGEGGRRGGGGGGDGGRGAGRGGRDRGDKGPRPGRRRGSPGQNSEQQDTDNTNPDFLLERFGNFAKITKFHLVVSDAIRNQLYELVLTSKPIRVFRSLLLQHNGRIRNTPKQLNTEDITPGDNKKRIETTQREIQAAFGTDKILQVSRTPHDDGGMSHLHTIKGKCVPKFLKRVDTAPNKRVPYDQFIQYPYLMGGDHNGNPRVTPRVMKDVCLLAGMLDANLCFLQIQDLMFELCMWRCVHELPAKADQHQSTRKDMAKQSCGLEANPFMTVTDEFYEHMACQGPYLSTKLTAEPLAHGTVK